MRWRASIVVCTYDAGSLTNLPALAKLLTHDVEGLVVDASRDDARADANRNAATRHGFRHVRAPPPNLSAQRNRAVADARAPVIVFVDDDCFPRTAAVNALVAAVERGDAVATARVVTPPDVAGDYDRAFDQDRGERSRSFTRRDLRVLPPLRFLLRPYGRDASLAPWAAGTGSCFAVDRDAYLRVGGCREDLGPGTPTLYGEDIDLFFRVLASGGHVGYVADAVVDHRHTRRERPDFLRTAHGYARGARAFLTANLRLKPGYAIVVALRPIQLLLSAGVSRARGDAASADMSLSALRGWVGLPPPREVRT